MENEVSKVGLNLPVFNDETNFALAQRMAKALCESSLVPKEYQKNTPNCLIALEMANRIGASPLMVMQHLNIIYGKPSWSSTFLIASINSCGRFESLRYKYIGEKNTDSWGCIAYTTDRKTGEILEGAEITIGMAKKEGWFSKSGSKWQSLPQLMLQYRSAAFFSRVYCPEITMGMQTADEVVDTGIIDISHVQKDVKNEIENNANKEELIIPSENKEEVPEKGSKKETGKGLDKTSKDVEEKKNKEQKKATEKIDTVTGEIKMNFD